jgi:hypothetical protein
VSLDEQPPGSHALLSVLSLPCRLCACRRWPHAADTEEYLHRLASKISNVKRSAEASKARQRAADEARAQVKERAVWWGGERGLAWRQR